MIFDACIIGGGFFGVRLALKLSALGMKTIILEKNNSIMQNASLVNQCRVHKGYHYPRSITTASTSFKNYEQFVKDYSFAIKDNFTNIYAIANNSSFCTAKSFSNFCKVVGMPLQEVDPHHLKLFNKTYIEGAFFANEGVFNPVLIANSLDEKIRENKHICFRSSFAVSQIEIKDKVITIKNKQNEKIVSKRLYNMAYANINNILSCVRDRVNLSLPLKFELAEVCIVRVPTQLKNIGITIMDGPFFSIIPQPQYGLHSFTHVRYTPHSSKLNNNNFPENLEDYTHSNFFYMKKASGRYIPLLKDIKLEKNLYVYKTVLVRNEQDDGRPIFIQRHSKSPVFCSILGAKIDNIYDLENIIKDYI